MIDDYNDIVGRSLVTAVVKENKELAVRLMEDASKRDPMEILCGIANGLIELKKCISEIDPEFGKEIEYICDRTTNQCNCTDCKEAEK